MKKINDIKNDRTILKDDKEEWVPPKVLKPGSRIEIIAGYGYTEHWFATFIDRVCQGEQLIVLPDGKEMPDIVIIHEGEIYDILS